MTNEGTGDIAGLIATSCRLLAMLGLAREKTGHVSARADGGAMWLRCRGSDEAGLAFTRSHAVRRFSLDGGFLDGSDAYEAPNEWPIHAAVYRARPDVSAVVHAHPYASTLVSICDTPLKPIVGAYDSSAMQLAVRGVPVYPHSRLICDEHSGAELAAVLGDKDCCILRGHGIVTVGSSVEEATLRAIRLETLSQLHLDVLKAGAQPTAISDDDLAFWAEHKAPKPGAGKGHGGKVDRWTWRHYEQLLRNHEAHSQFKP